MTDLYFEDDANLSTCQNAKDGPITLANFQARIDTERVYHDGEQANTIYGISGKMRGVAVEGQPIDVELPAVNIKASDFATMSWVSDKWGARPIIFPQSSAERHLSTAIKLFSQPVKQDIYTHTGWVNINGVDTFLSATGGISAKGYDPTITVQLPNELKNYALPSPAPNKDAVLASLRLANLGPKNVLWPLLLGTYRAAMGGSDFALHLAGRTGTYKSELAALMQSHYGQLMDARHLPASWSSTANALEALCYRSKDAIIVVDDFVPTGSSYAVKNLQKAADQLIRGQGNQAGRSRLTDVSALQNTMFPRGMILSTGEDIPEGHSVRARMMIVEVAPNDIDTGKLSEAQANRALFSSAMAQWVYWLAHKRKEYPERFAQLSRDYRDANLGTGHSRTPPMIGDLLATSELILEWCADNQFLITPTRATVRTSMKENIVKQAEHQETYLMTADPVNTFIDALRVMLDTKKGHLKTRDGAVPMNPQLVGWDVVEQFGHATTYRTMGARIGWIDWDAGEVYIDPNQVIAINKLASNPVQVTAQTLIKRMKEAGVLTRVETTRQRNTVRINAEGATRQVLAMNIATVIPEVDPTKNDID